MAGLPHLFGVETEDEFVVGFDMVSEDFGHLLVRFITIRAKGCGDGPKATLWLARALEREFRLHALDYIFIPGQEVPGLVRCDGGRRMCVDVCVFVSQVKLRIVVEALCWFRIIHVI